MVGGSPYHYVISDNVNRTLGRRLEDEPGAVFNASLQVRFGQLSLYNQPEVTFHRNAEGIGPIGPGLAAVGRLKSLGIELPLAELHAGVTLAKAIARWVG